jgi:hypothetical protein
MCEHDAKAQIHGSGKQRCHQVNGKLNGKINGNQQTDLPQRQPVASLKGKIQQRCEIDTDRLRDIAVIASKHSRTVSKLHDDPFFDFILQKQPYSGIL